MTFEFASAGRIHFGGGQAKALPGLVSGFGRKALLVLGGSGRGRAGWVDALAGEGVESVVFLVPHEPTTHLVDEATRVVRDERCDVVVGIGGGSVLDAAKAVAGLATNPGAILDYLEVVGKGRPLANPGLPFVAVPTTAGTGTEVTRNAVLDVPEHRVKVSLRSPHLLARVAVVDPELTASMTPEVTAYTGMDALTQLIEPFVSKSANPLTDGVCREGLPRAARSLRRAFHRGDDIEAREDMAFASLCGGLALANAKLGAVHGFAGVLGGLTGSPHGALCARLLPFVMAANIRAIGERGNPATRARFEEVARILTGDPSAKAEDGVAFVEDLGRALRIPGLAALNLTSGDIPGVIPQAQRASSMQGNPLPLTDDELRGILDAAL